jgi:hypothetical protein
VRGATFRADGASDPHLRINVVFGQHRRLGDYLSQRLQAAAAAGQVLARARAKA